MNYTIFGESHGSAIGVTVTGVPAGLALDWDLIAAEMALAGIPQLIPFDEMLAAMYAVGKRIPAELRETALGGCAAAPSACGACKACS